ncbi:unnamed protein product [Calypogeia fissa]
MSLAAADDAAGPSRGGLVLGLSNSNSRNPSRNVSKNPSVIHSMVPSKASSRLPSQLPSRSHSPPSRLGFDPHETPSTCSRPGSAQGSGQNSPGPDLVSNLDDFDL